ncbi:MAG: hypothetical protein ABH830_02480 [Patescibacteria group bacterium]
MEFLKNLDLKPAKIFKIAGVALIAIILIALTFKLIGSTLNSFGLSNAWLKKGLNSASLEAPGLGTAQMFGKGVDYSMDESASLSVRNIVGEVIPPSDSGYASGDDSEEYEVKEYDATIETRELENTCQTVASLKVKEYVIFENSSEYDKGCNYTFKVKKDNVEEILTIINELNPKELTENAYTIKRIVEDFTSEIEILEKKKLSIEETLDKAITAYDEISDLATRTQDAETLAKIIDSKIRIIERLTTERINVSAQLERLARSKAEQLDRLDYTYFYVYIYENKYIDGENLKDSWKQAIKEFVRDINNVAQAITVNLVSALFVIFQYLIYLFILLVIGKYGWKFIKRFWQK